jgi:hypothetical protein
VVQDFALSHLMARPSMDDVNDGNLILFPEAAEVARAYVMNQPMNLFVLVGPHSAEKFKANIEAREVRLTPGEMDWLDLRTESR